jgi:hypothetical protein
MLRELPKDKVMKVLKGALTAALILSSSFTAFAETAKAPLPAGKPAGVRNAAFEGQGLVLALGIAAIVGFTVALASSNGGGVTSPTTTSTSTTGLP